MSIDQHVDVLLTTDSLGLARDGFGIPLVLSVNATFPERVRYYESTSGVEDDGFPTDSPEYLTVSAIFQQELHPNLVAIGRATGKPTMRYQINIAQVTEGADYSIEVKGQGVTEETVSYTAGAGDAATDIATALHTDLNAVVGKNFSSVDNADGTLTVTGTAAGDWFSLKINNISLMDLYLDHTEPGTSLETDLNAIQLADDDWYALYTLYNSKDYMEAAFEWAESKKKLYVGDSNDSRAATTTVGTGGDPLRTLFDSNYTRSAGMYYGDASKMAGARWMGRCLPIDPGTETWAYQTLAGLPAEKLTATQRKNLDDRQATYYKSEAGQAFTWQGKVGDSSIIFIDFLRFRDLLVDDLAKEIFGVLLAADKISFDDHGIAQIEGSGRGILDKYINRGLAEDPAPSMKFPKVADVQSSNKALRHLPRGKFNALYDGAIHTVKINGVISV